MTYGENGGAMALKAITLRLDEEEYEKLKQNLEKFGDPDINVAYVLRSYIRDINRALPFLVASGWDLKNYFGMLGSWLKQFGATTDAEMFSKMMVNPWALWGAAGAAPEKNTDNGEPVQDKGNRAAEADSNRRKD
jgi:hypothetical protein